MSRAIAPTRWIAYFCAMVALGLVTPAPADDLAPIRQTISALIVKDMKADNVPGLSVALVDEHGVVWAEGFGYADVADRMPAKAGTIYSTGTLTTVFTAAAVMQLVERGAIGLDKPLRTYLPDFSIRSRFDSATPITPRNLLTQHSGLPAMHFKGMWARRPQSLADFVASLRDEYVAYPPDYVYDPSEPGYSVLGRLIEVRTREGFAQYMQDRLLAPLGMRDSSFDRARLDPALLAKGYWRGKTEAAPLSLRDTPAVGLYSSVTDVARFLEMLFNGGELDGRRVLSTGSVAEMLRAQNTRIALDLDNRVGLAWRLSGVRLEHARRVAWQSNGSPIARGSILIAPDEKLGVVVLANTSGGSHTVEQVSETLLEMALQQRQPAPAETATNLIEGRTSAASRDTGSARGPRLGPIAEPRPHAAAAPSEPPAPQALAGRYASILGMITVTGDGDAMSADVLGKTLALERDPDGLFRVGFRFLGLIPIPISVLKEVRLQPATIGGRRFVLAHYKDHLYRFADRIAPAPLPPAWRARLGMYQVVDSDPLLDLVKLQPLELRYDDGMLYFYYRLPGWFGLAATAPVKVVSDTELVLAGTGWLMGETIRVVHHGREERLRYSGYELRRVRK